jgi:hypothetical protein
MTTAYLRRPFGAQVLPLVLRAPKRHPETMSQGFGEQSANITI